MNQNYVRKCEEYLLNIPSQKLSNKQNPTVGINVESGRNISSRNSTRLLPGSQEKQSINNSVAVIEPAGKEGKLVPVVPNSSASNGQQQRRLGHGKQQGTKFIRPCCRQRQSPTVRSAGGSGPLSSTAPLRRGRSNGKASDNVNQNDNTEPAKSDGDYRQSGEGKPEPKTTAPQPERNAGTETWDGILAAKSSSSLKSKSTQLSGPPSSLECSTPRPASSIATVAPHRRPTQISLVPNQNHHHSGKESESEALPEINIFRFDPLRTLELLMLELKSKLKALCPEHKQLYNISKEMQLALKVLSKQWIKARESNNETPIADNDLNRFVKPEPPSPAKECSNCALVRNCLEAEAAKHNHEKQLLEHEINYWKAYVPTRNGSSRDSAKEKRHLTETDQQQKLAGEIKRLEAMINDKQTLEAALIADLNRKLQEATSRSQCLEHARNEAEKRLLYATVENERLNFLVSTQSSTMGNLRSDFSTIHTLAQELDRTTSVRTGPRSGGSGTQSTDHSKTANSIADNNHRRNYRYPSGGSRDRCGAPDWQSPPPPSSSSSSSPLPSNATQETLAYAAEKARKRRNHYSFKNIAEKESDGGNDANDFNPHTEGNPADETPSGSNNGSPNDHGSGDGNAVAFHHWKKHQRPRQRWEAHCARMTEAGIGSGIGTDERTSSGTGLRPTSSSSPQVSNGSITSDRFCESQTTATIAGNPGSAIPSNAILSPATANGAGIADGGDYIAHRHQLEPGRPTSAAGKAAKENPPSDAPENITGCREKYPRDYGDKFERCESSLLAGKELCQNRPIIGQLRSGAALAGAHQTISATNEPSSARTEEFSIDFDDITLPCSPTSFAGGFRSSMGFNDFSADDDSSGK